MQEIPCRLFGEDGELEKGLPLHGESWRYTRKLNQPSFCVTQHFPAPHRTTLDVHTVCKLVISFV